MRAPTFLMVDPAHFEVAYAINPWMAPDAWQADRAAWTNAARRGFTDLAAALRGIGAHVEAMPGVPGAPDLVFPANAAVVLDGRAILARFLHPERQVEEPVFKRAFDDLCARGQLDEVAELPRGVFQEGAGDFIWDATRDLFWAGYGQRSDRRGMEAVANFFGRETVALKLATPRFYHLDTCFCPLPGGEILYYPPAFTPASQRLIKEHVAAAQLIEGRRRGCGAVLRQRGCGRPGHRHGEGGGPAAGAARGARLRRSRGRSRALHHVGRRRLLHDAAPRPRQRRRNASEIHRGCRMSDVLTRDPAMPEGSGPDYIAIEAEYGARNYKPLDVVLTRGQGAYVWDVDGNRYLDCLAAYSAVNQGHCHPKILEAMVAQAGKLTLTSRAFRNDQLAPFYAELCALTGSHKVLPMNSGAEAVESALKVARKWGYQVKGVPTDRAEIIVCADNFHGRTLGIIGFSTDPTSRDNFGPFAPGFVVVPYGDADALAQAIGPEHGRLPRRADPGRGRRRHPARRLLAPRATALHRQQRRDDPRRDPDRARPNRQAARRGARRDRGRPDADRQGARRRLLSDLRRALEQRGARRAEAGRARLDLRRQPRSPAPSPAPRCACWSRRA